MLNPGSYIDQALTFDLGKQLKTQTLLPIASKYRPSFGSCIAVLFLALIIFAVISATTKSSIGLPISPTKAAFDESLARKLLMPDFDK